MSHYRGYFMKDERIVAPAIIDAADDAQAMLKAGQLLSTSQFPCIEVWQETRVVGALSAAAPSDHNVAKVDPHSSKGDVPNIAVFDVVSSAEVGAIHAEALTLQRPLPDLALRIVARGEKKDGE